MYPGLPSLEEVNEIYERNNLSKTADYYRKGCAACLVGALAIDAGVEIPKDGEAQGIYNAAIELKLGMRSNERFAIVLGYDDGFMGAHRPSSLVLASRGIISRLYYDAYAIGEAHREEQNATTSPI